MHDYLRQVGEDFMLLQREVGDLQREQNRIMGSFGLNQQKISQYVAQLRDFMQTLLVDENITLGDTRAHIQMKTEYLNQHG